MIVIDASALLEFLLDTARGRSIGDRMELPGESVHAPHVLDVEVVSALRKNVRWRRIGALRGQTALTDLRDVVITRYPHEDLLGRMWQLRENASAYDAAYLALAEALHAPLLTCDRRLAAVPGHAATIEVF
jgi:predicted nucleic acid-binding protein